MHLTPPMQGWLSFSFFAYHYLGFAPRVLTAPDARAYPPHLVHPAVLVGLPLAVRRVEVKQFDYLCLHIITLGIVLPPFCEHRAGETNLVITIFLSIAVYTELCYHPPHTGKHRRGNAMGKVNPATHRTFLPLARWSFDVRSYQQFLFHISTT